MRKLFLLGAAASLAFFTSCTHESPKTADADKHDSVQEQHQTTDGETAHWETVGEKNGIRVSYMPESPDFPDAKLTLVKPDKDAKDLPVGKVMFQYKVENFKLTEQTPGEHADHCANSKQGQHIHTILNNEPYTAHYTDTFSQKLEKGNYLNLSFLSRSYHESIKHKDAYQLSQFTVGMKGWKGTPYDLTKPMLFYSRPKGEYVGKDTKIILLDFYLVNTDLSESGNKVRALINGNEFILTKWAPYAITGLPMGENTIKLELLDKDLKPIPGPYNSVERKITLKAEEGAM